MSTNLCRLLFTKICVHSNLGASLLKSDALGASKLLQIETNQIGRAGFASDRRKLGLRKQKWPEYPQIECIGELNVKTFLATHFKEVQYGDYKFIESADGYVQVYVEGYVVRKYLDTRATYSVYFGDNHPLNLAGGFEGRQRKYNARLHGIMKALHQVPKNLFKNVCICVSDLAFLKFIDRDLRSASENSFRCVRTGKLIEDLETNIEINKALRLRRDLVFRLKYIPDNIGMDNMRKAAKLAEKVYDDVNKEYFRQKIQRHDR